MTASERFNHDGMHLLTGCNNNGVKIARGANCAPEYSSSIERFSFVPFQQLAICNSPAKKIYSFFLHPSPVRKQNTATGKITTCFTASFIDKILNRMNELNKNAGSTGQLYRKIYFRVLPSLSLIPLLACLFFH